MVKVGVREDDGIEKLENYIIIKNKWKIFKYYYIKCLVLEDMAV